MIRTVASKVVWVGRATVFLVGLAVILALVFGLAAVAFAANGDPWLLGRSNVATAITSLGGAAGVNGPMVRLTNNNGDTNDTALDLRVQAGEAPMKVNSATKVTNLNADQLDGKDFSAFNAQQDVISSPGPLPVQGTYTSKGGTLIISAFGSGYRGTGSSLKEGWIGMYVYVDGAPWGHADVYTNERNSHQAFISSVIVIKEVPAGAHTIRLERIYQTACNTASEQQSTHCTATDANDHFHVTVMELPD